MVPRLWPYCGRHFFYWDYCISRLKSFNLFIFVCCVCVVKLHFTLCIFMFSFLFEMSNGTFFLLLLAQKSLLYFHYWSKFHFHTWLKYQPSGEGGARSPHATPHRLQNPKWPPGGPKMAEGVWKGVYP